jgi:DNA mismatch endonuclease, patch repair protein
VLMSRDATARLAGIVLPPAPPPSSQAVRRIMQGNKGRDTSPEVALRSALHKKGLRFRKHRRPLKSLRCDADLVFAREKVAVFIDGCFWHGCPQHGRRPKANAPYWRAKIDRNQARDARNDAVLRAAGWRVIRAWEHESTTVVAGRVVQAILSRRGLLARN